MGVPVIPGCPAFAITPPATAFSTAVMTIIPPGPAVEGGALLYGQKPGSNGLPNWWQDGWYIHITDLIVTCSTTANIIYILRPTNFTTFSAAVAKNATSITLADDPGVYSTNYRYKMPGISWNPPGTANTIGPGLADLTISSTNKFVAYQTASGVWHADTIASGTFGGANLVLTGGTGNYTGETIAANAPLFYFGVNTGTVPYTQNAHLIRTPIVSTQQVNLLAGWGGNASAVGGGGGASSGNGIPAFNPGDPIIIYNPNATATTTVDFIGGYYAKY